MLNFIMAIMRWGELSLQLADSTHAPVAPNEPAWRGTCVETKGCACWSHRDPPPPIPS